MRRVPLLILPLLLLACQSEPEDTRPGQPVKSRQQIFKQMVRGFEPMGQMLKSRQFDGDRFMALAEAWGPLVTQPWPHFAPGTDYPPSKSTPAVWAEPEQFAARRQDFERAAEGLLQAAKTRDPERIGPAYRQVHDSCQACHKTFRVR